jgi:uncharacterized protein (DUF924 family)
MDRIESILDFWFGALQNDFDFPEEKAKLWFRGGEAFNEAIRKQFSGDVQQARKGELDAWQKTPRGTLALIILLDQFTRNLNQDHEAFTADPKALAIARESITKGFDVRLKRVERAFLYLPFEHAEDLKMQERSVQLFDALVTGAPASVDLMYQNMLEFARQHHKIVERFRRFPHRNEALGRTSTPEELQFLKESGLSF